MRAWLKSGLFNIVLVAAVGNFSAVAARAQQGGGKTPPDSGAIKHDPSGTPSPTVNLAGLSNPEKIRKEVEDAAKEAKVERQRRIVKDTDKLMKLMAELKASVEGMNGDQASAQTVKQLEQIEKLAADIKKQSVAK